MKHAYLILAHTEFELLKLLVSCLDDERNDIYVHIDKKVAVLPDLHTEKAGLHVLENRIDVRWGDVTVVEAEYALFEAAVANGPYQYYHLLSGVDLPLKSQDYIHRFCDENNGKEFIGYTLTEITPEVVRKVQRWHLFPEDFRNKSVFKRMTRAGFIRLQECLGIKRNKDIDFKKGSQWISITDGMAHHFLANKSWAMRVFRNTFCSDEIVMQTLCWYSPFRGNIYNTANDGLGCMRAIGWKNGRLHDWAADDYDTLKKSSALFARKFNLSDPFFLNRILRYNEV